MTSELGLREREVGERERASGTGEGVPQGGTESSQTVGKLGGRGRSAGDTGGSRGGGRDGGQREGPLPCSVVWVLPCSSGDGASRRGASSNLLFQDDNCWQKQRRHTGVGRGWSPVRRQLLWSRDEIMKVPTKTVSPRREKKGQMQEGLPKANRDRIWWLSGSGGKARVGRFSAESLGGRWGPTNTRKDGREDCCGAWRGEDRREDHWSG